MTARPTAARAFFAASIALAGCSLGHEDAFMCSDGARNGAETDVDCGGACARCAFGRGCATSEDCGDGATCSGGKCAPVELRKPEWKRLETSGALPARYGAGVSLRSGDRSLLVFGGKSDAAGVLGDTWLLRLDREPPAWEQASPTESPAARYYPGFADVPGLGAVLAGGEMPGIVYSAESWVHDATGWKQIEDLPTARSGLAMAFDPDRHKLGVFGGAPIAPGTFEHDGTAGGTWQPVTTDHQPPARANARMAYDRARRVMVLFGGRNENDAFFNDTWEYDGHDWVETVPGPPPRERVAMAYDDARQRLVVLGGFKGVGGGGGNRDTWEFDGVTWRRIDAELDEVEFVNRFNATMVYDPSRRRMLIVDGCTAGFDELAGAWQYVGLGTTCDASDDCGKGSCVDGVCCEADPAGGCPAGQVCNGREAPGICGPP